jgi:hypothetical protein
MTVGRCVASTKPGILERPVVDSLFDAFRDPLNERLEIVDKNHVECTMATLVNIAMNAEGVLT